MPCHRRQAATTMDVSRQEKQQGAADPTGNVFHASLDRTRTSSTIVATPGIGSSTSSGASCQSDCATGHIGSDHWNLV